MDLISGSIYTHILAIFGMFIIMVSNFFIVTSQENFFKLATRLKFVTPIFHSLNFVVFYTGAVIIAFVYNMDPKNILMLKPTVILMIFVTIFLMVLEIKRYKKMRVITLKDYKRQEEFKKYAKKIYLIQIVTLIISYTIFKLYAGI